MDPMEIALQEARAAARQDEVPVGAVVVDPDGRVVACARNASERGDAADHAEMIALRMAAAARGTSRLEGCDLFVTLEPCPMCAGAIGLFRIRRLVFGAYDPKGGAVEHGPRLFERAGCGHRPEVIGGVRERDAALLLRRFFTVLR